MSLRHGDKFHIKRKLEIAKNNTATEITGNNMNTAASTKRTL